MANASSPIPAPGAPGYEVVFEFQTKATATQMKRVLEHSPAARGRGNETYFIAVPEKKAADAYQAFLRQTDETGVDPSSIEDRELI